MDVAWTLSKLKHTYLSILIQFVREQLIFFIFSSKLRINYLNVILYFFWCRLKWTYAIRKILLLPFLLCNMQWNIAVTSATWNSQHILLVPTYYVPLLDVFFISWNYIIGGKKMLFIFYYSSFVQFSFSQRNCKNNPHKWNSANTGS